jgi:hypothetical protein
MLKVEAVAKVWYTCTLSEKEEKKVREYAEENNVSLDEAIRYLFENDYLDVYEGSFIESDCSTEEAYLSEFNNEGEN